MNLPPGARQQADGSITFPMRGPPPTWEPPANYVRDPTDPYRFVMSYKPCKYRTIGVRVKCPLGSRLVDQCILLGLPVGPAYCQQCSKREV